MTVALILVGAAMGATSRQALRTCVDRWNQGNMLHWGRMSVRVAIRGLDARERSVLSIPNPSKRRCTVSLAGRPGDSTWICILAPTGAYDCPLHTSDGMPPLRNANAATDRRGILELDVPLVGTHATPPLSWHRYPHVDGLIHPWTSDASLRRGLSFRRAGGRHLRGRCVQGSEDTRDPAALTCVSDVRFGACYPSTRSWNRRGAIVACAGAGSRRFDRFVISRRS